MILTANSIPGAHIVTENNHEKVESVFLVDISVVCCFAVCGGYSVRCRVTFKAVVVCVCAHVCVCVDVCPYLCVCLHVHVFVYVCTAEYRLAG